MREPALEGVSRSCSSGRRAGRSRPAVSSRPGTMERRRCCTQPFGDAARGSRSHSNGSASIGAHALGEEGRERELAARIGRDLGVRAGRGARRPATSSSWMPSKRRTSPAKTKVSPATSVSAKYSSTSPSTRPPRRHAVPGRGRRMAAEPDLDHRRLDDGADIQPVLLGDAGVAHPPEPVLALHDLGEALIGPQRIAAGRDEGDDALEILPASDRA